MICRKEDGKVGEQAVRIWDLTQRVGERFATCRTTVYAHVSRQIEAHMIRSARRDVRELAATY